ncbi:MAG TPA: Gfo/Idh/MocA family oxidoreductase [Steroidobacteraceae bacterium]|nr:Gfo/Idh/MocA family oxidoreductase [Steroidobacteraceae bacterium]
MSSDLRVALVGYGLGGRAFHAPLIAITPGLRLTTIVTANPERRAAAARDFPDARIVDSADEVWANADGHDLVVITTPNRFHVPLARAAVASLLAVVVDKPMAATANEARELVAEAQRAGVPLTAYHNRRWDGEMLTAGRLIESGELGTVVRFESRLDRWRPTPAANVWRERGKPEEAGGLLYDLGPHLIDQARLLFGPVAEVYAEVERRRPGAHVDDDVFIALHHSSGTRSHLWASSVAAQAGMRMRVLGTRAAYTKAHADVQEAALRAGKRADEPGFGEDPPDQWGTLGAGSDTRPVKTEKGDYQRFYAQAVPWLRDGAPPPVDPADAIAVLEIIEAAQRSSAEAKVVRFPQGC